MSMHMDYAEISRQARRIVDANRARAVVEQELSCSSDISPGSNGEAPRKKVKYTRSTKGCLGCRKHKVKCDETLPACLRCIAGQRLCEYPHLQNASTGSQQPLSAATSTSASSKAQPRLNGSGNGGIDSAARAGTGTGILGSDPGRIAGMEGVKANGFASGNGNGNGSSMGVVGDAGISNSIWKNGEPSHSNTIGQPGGNTNEGPFWSTSDLFALHATSGQDQPSPNLSFLNDLLNFTPAPTLPPIETSPSQVLPLNFLASTSAAVNPEPLPHFASLTKSRLLNRRTAKSTPTMQPIDLAIMPMAPVPAHPRLMLVDSILQAYAFDDTLFEFGPSHRTQASLTGTSIHGGTDVLANGFPSSSARTLFHHYCNVSSRILVTMGNIGPNPLLTLCTPNKLLDTSSAASAAIRMSMLSTSIAHFTHETVELVGVVNLGPGWPDQKGRLDAMGRKFKKAALSNILLAETTETNPEHVDSILAACTLICIRDVISADPTWADNMEFALKLVNKKGGPQAMLKTTKGSSFTRRYLLENLATHDVFSCFITGKEPAILGNYDCWWFESVETSQTRWEWESVERTFGISRAMVDLVARVVTLDSRKRRLGIVMSGHPEEMVEIGQHFVRESHCLLLEADIWGNSLSALPQHSRVTCGDYIYKYMVVVFILADILEQPITTPRISKAVDSVLELCSEATAMRMSVMLIWPLLISGLFCLPEMREKVSSLFDAFQGDYCEDLVVARALLEEQWRLLDAGQSKRPWSEIMRRLNRYALLI